MLIQDEVSGLGLVQRQNSASKPKPLQHHPH